MLVLRRCLHDSARASKREGFDKVFPKVQHRRKAWEGQDKDTFFREKYAHVHVRQKKQQQERRAQLGTKDVTKDKEKTDQFDQFFGKDYKPRGGGSGGAQRGYNRNTEQDADARYDNSNNNEKRTRRMGRNQNKPRRDVDLTGQSRTRLKPEPWKEMMYGTGPVTAALQAGKRPFSKIYTTDEAGLANTQIPQLAEMRNVGIEYKSRLDLNLVTKNAVHNGVVLETRPLQTGDVDSLSQPTDSPSQYNINVRDLNEVDVQTRPVKADKPHALAIYIDQVTDAHNLGAIIRSTYYLGADMVVFSEKNCCKLNEVVAKTAVGAMDLLPIYNAPEPLDFFTKSTNNGWNVVAATPHPQESKQIRLSQLSDLLKEAPCLLVLGSEGRGLRKSLMNRATHQVALTPHHDTTTVDSLNVSVAAALMLSKFMDPNAFD